MPQLANKPEKLLTEHHLAADCMHPELKGYPKISAERAQFLHGVKLHDFDSTYLEQHPEKYTAHLVNFPEESDG